MHKTQIVCTLGPASQDKKILTKMVKNGLRVARLNFSHGTYENHSLLLKNIRAVAAKLKTPVLIMQDLQGPKIRVADLRQSVNVKAGKQVVIGRDFDIDFNPAPYAKPGQRILIEDGLVELLVVKVNKNLVYCKAQNSGIIQSHKGVNFPDTALPVPSMTEKDMADLKFGLTKNVDLVALSFVRHASDVQHLKKFIKDNLLKGFKVPQVVVKIEKPEGVANFNHILKVTDWVMVARGDLGVEVPASHVPVMEKMMVHKCRLSHKPVIVATQMLDSMIRNPRPTRAEVSDVANAVIEGANYVMLSGETAFGAYPLEAVKQMKEIIDVVERSKYVKQYKL